MANHITRLRKKSGFETAKEAAKKLKISDSMMYQMEGGYKQPSSNLGIKMAEVFNCTLEEIFLPFNTTNSDKNIKEV
ncbi:helix-turn-helix transcriptional regulator [Anaerosalibacter massiliensis]|uniref:helix-turn-helix transcriptional regulator n=1 Tax=Anaerosalibacter massiliensis TaxID=1347392 RepID=UPI0005B2AD01|nr:helix-turn-helix transcriptional regulator [Anaerosalibacter massiliensis]